MFVVGRGGIEFAQVLPAFAALAMQIAAANIAQCLVGGIGHHHVATVVLIHQFQRIGHWRLRAHRRRVVRRILGLDQ